MELEKHNFAPILAPFAPKTLKSDFSKKNIYVNFKTLCGAAKKPQKKSFPKIVVSVNFKLICYYTYAKTKKNSEYQCFIKLKKHHFGSILDPLGTTILKAKLFSKK